MDIVYVFDLFGTAIFAITGAVKGVRNRLDFLGVVVFAITVGCGGGMVRDVLLDISPISAFSDSAYVYVCIAMGVIVFLLAPKIVGRWNLIQYCDAIGLGVFTALGCVKAAEAGLGPVAVVFSSVCGAVGGGVLRDIFSRETPMVFTSDFYATASISGCVLFLILDRTGLDKTLVLYSTAIFTAAARITGYKLKWRLPVARTIGDVYR